MPSPTYASARDADGRLLDEVHAEGQVETKLSMLEAGQRTVKVALEGVVTNVAPNDTVVVMRRDWDGKPCVDVPNDAGPLRPGPPPPGGAAQGSTEFVLAWSARSSPSGTRPDTAVTEVTATAAQTSI